MESDHSEKIEMIEERVNKLEISEKRISDPIVALNQRIDDIKTFVTTSIAAGSTLFGILAIVFTWNVSSEKKGLRDFMASLKEEVLIEVGKQKSTPEIQLMTKTGKVLNGAIINAEIDKDDEGELFIYAPIKLTNKGKGRSGIVTVKTYTDKRIKLDMEDTDLPEFQYAHIWQGKEESSIPDMPGGLSYIYQLRLWPQDSKKPSPGEYPILIRIYYGQGELEQAKIKLVIK